MGGWRVGRLVIAAGAVGILFGVLLGSGAQDSETGLGVMLSLVLLGLAAWHFWAWGLGKLVAIGLLAAGALQFTLVDFGDGDLLWEQGLTGVQLVGGWLVIASAAVVLIGVLGSFIEVAGSPKRRSEDLAGSVAWWRKWGLAVVGVAVALWVLGQIFTETDDGPVDTADQGDLGRLQDEGWSIALDDDRPGVHLISMIKTFAAPDEDRFVEEDDLDGLDGRLVWDETEIELCGVGIRSVGVGEVQIGDIFETTTEGCGANTEMQQAFDDFGVPETACVHVRWSAGVEDEYCAPLAVE